MEDKIRYWRENVEEAAGMPEGERDDLLQRQKVLQQEWMAAGAVPGGLMFGNLVGWRQQDLGRWSQQQPGASPMVPPTVAEDEGSEASYRAIG